MRGKQLSAISDRLTSMYRLLDKLDRSVERIEIVTVVREPNTSLSADAYNGLRKQVIAAVSERTAHMHQLAQFDAALRANASSDELATLVREWLGQASLRVVEDPGLPDGFTFVGPEDGTTLRLVRPAYVDDVTGRVISAGVAERVVEAPEPEPEPEPEQAAATEEPQAVVGTDEPTAGAAGVTPTDAAAPDEAEPHDPSLAEAAPASGSPSTPGGAQ